MIVENKKNIKEVEQEKSQRIMETIAWQAGFQNMVNNGAMNNQQLNQIMSMARSMRGLFR